MSGTSLARASRTDIQRVLRVSEVQQTFRDRVLDGTHRRAAWTFYRGRLVNAGSSSARNVNRSSAKPFVRGRQPQNIDRVGVAQPLRTLAARQPWARLTSSDDRIACASDHARHIASSVGWPSRKHHCCAKHEPPEAPPGRCAPGRVSRSAVKRAGVVVAVTGAPSSRCFALRRVDSSWSTPSVCRRP